MKKITIQEAIKLFCEACQSHGLLITENTVIADGRKHRCPVIQSKSSKTSGSYCLHASSESDFPFNGFFINFNTGDSDFKWNIMRFIHDNFFKYKKIKSQDKLPKIFYEEENELYKKIAYIADKIYHQGTKSCSGDTYLKLKQVNGYGIKFQSFNGQDNILIVPGRDFDGNIWTLQTITPDGRKHFLKDGKLHGTCHKIDFDSLPTSYTGYIIICEGYATGSSIYMATSYPTICAFSSGNIPNVATQVQQHWPKANILYCADLDYSGINKAFQAKSLTWGTIILPILNNLTEDAVSDFNDIHCKLGLQTVKEQILQQIDYKDFNIEKLSQELFHNIISENQIQSNHLQIADLFIKFYHIYSYVIDMVKAESNQLTMLNNINSNYKQAVLESFVNFEAKRILNISSLEEREACIEKFVPELQDLIKQKLSEL